MDEKINYSVFTTFLTDEWKLKGLSDDVCGKLWKALIKFFRTGEDTSFGDDTMTQFIYEDLKQSNIRNATKNRKKNQNRNGRQSEPNITVGEQS